MTKYDFERSVNNYQDGSALRDALYDKGMNADWLIKRHNAHCAKVSEIQQLLSDRGLDVRTVNHSGYTADAVSWADAVITAGGDGTLLFGASEIHDRNKPMLGINTDPDYSMGYLCLPRWCTGNLSKAFDMILAGSFRLLLRNRIRVALICHRDTKLEVTTLGRHKVVPVGNWPEKGGDVAPDPSDLLSDVQPRVREHMSRTVLPVVALNEVYVGEALSARMSQYEISIDGKTSVRQKSSGVVISTGTGSTSWYRNIAGISTQAVLQLLQIARHLGDIGQTVQCSHGGPETARSHRTMDAGGGEGAASEIAEVYNATLRFAADDTRMAFAVRDPLCNAVFNVAQPCGFAKKIQVRSLMVDAQLVFDGGYSFPFPCGSVAEFSIDPADAIGCIQLNTAQCG